MNDRLTKSFRRDDWLKVRNNLKDKSVLDAEWRTAISILKERIFERYFDPLKMLLDNSKNKGEGFTIVTIECALIEFLATLEEGRIFKRKKESTDSHYYYKESARIYHRFLQKIDVFASCFPLADGSKPLFSPYDFYLNVRCALIHEAQTRSNWVVRIYSNADLDKKNTNCFMLETDGTKVIYRTALYLFLKIYFLDFTETKLTQDSERGRVLRRFLARKIDHIAEVPPDKKYWWLK